MATKHDLKLALDVAAFKRAITLRIIGTQTVFTTVAVVIVWWLLAPSVGADRVLAYLVLANLACAPLWWWLVGPPGVTDRRPDG